MRNKLAQLLSCLLLVNPLVLQYRNAAPGYRYEFPRDNFNHPDFQTEWWYYTGNLRTSDGHEFGFELTFFREALTREAQAASDWSAPDAFVAHLALSDISGGKFYREEELYRLAEDVPTRKISYVHRQEVLVWTPLAMIVFVTLITAEWLVRKFSNLS